MMRPGPFAGLLGLATGLAACSWWGESASTPPACPQVQIAVPADRIGNNGPDGQLRYVASMSDVESDCRYQDEDDGEGIELDLAFLLLAEKAPAYDGVPVALTYFVATVDPAQQIIGKQLFVANLTLPRDRNSAGIVEELTVRLPTPTDGAASSYRVYIGFQPDGPAGG